jgi:hypothetical protein
MLISRREPPTTSLPVALRLTTAQAAKSGTTQIHAEITFVVTS